MQRTSIATPGGGTASSIVEALAWMAREQVPVINISLVGPANRTLEGALRTLLARGHVIRCCSRERRPSVAAAVPARVSGRVGVTAVDVRKNVLPEAVRGPQVAFSAPGAEMAVAVERLRAAFRARAVRRSPRRSWPGCSP
jgi:hypothetical protein